MKLCGRCKREKSLSDFYSHNGRPAWQCKTCTVEATREWREKNPEARRAIVLRELEARKLFRPAKHVSPFANRKERDKAYYESVKRKPEFMAARAANLAARKARKRNATPVWANKFFIEEAYALAKLRSEMFGFPWHVDHIVPLRSKLVCGLHAECNLQVIPMAANQKKGNRHWPNMPEGK